MLVSTAVPNCHHSFILDLSDEELRREFTKEEIQENVRLKPHPQFHNDIKLANCQFLPKYQESIKNLKKNGFEVVGYARKSPSNDKNENRLKLLQKMVDNLENRSLTTRIYVSFSSCASTPFSERDTTTSKSTIASLRNVNGDTQGKS
ncbi:hypothetical protein G6F56_005492 [Rhizopus delemar]|nr:hypothetical protein G6F56_005492 [Rhizopus delemar]